MTITFSALALSEPILRALTEEGYKEPTPIQESAIPSLLEGRDILAAAQTGTGKTAAFMLPILERLFVRSRPASRGRNSAPRVLIVAPTRELAVQIDESARAYGRHLRIRTAVVLGGVPFGRQLRSLAQNPEIIVATPGRLVDLMRRGALHLDRVEVLILDEADRMLDMGFLPDVRTIVGATPQSRQTALFSATLTKEIAQLAAGWLKDPAHIEVSPPASVSEAIAQRVLFVERGDKQHLLQSMLGKGEIRRALVFTKTKHRANKVAENLIRCGIGADAIHANKSQGARQRALAGFSSGKTRVLVATDIVARGIDVEGISHVINFELPNEPESYVHRIGRTARAGRAGIALSLCDADELDYLRDIERLTKTALVMDSDHEYHSDSVANLRKSAAQPQQFRRSSGRPQRFGQRRRPPMGRGRG